jgi:MFS family permease
MISSHRSAFHPDPAARLIVAMCVAEVLGMMGIFAFPALLPRFVAEWTLSNTQAGWINGIYFAGYTAAVPVLVSLTDRMDGRRIYLAGAAAGALSMIGFALVAKGFWTALLFRALAGLALAGTFIPGLKALVDRLEATAQARAVSFYTATFSVGTSLSFFATGALATKFGWRWAFALGAAGAVLALLVAAAALRPRSPRPAVTSNTRLLDFRPVFRNREAMAYILAYATHCWELFAFRSWIVAFLAFNLGLQSHQHATYWAPATVAALVGLVAMWASVGGAELALRFGRRRVLSVIMLSSALFALGMGLSARLPYPAVAVLCVLYSLFVQGDSATLHMGTVQTAEPERRGATMAVQSLLGFASAAVGPLAVGIVLDATGGGRTVHSWAAAFLSMGVVVAVGPLFLALMGHSAAGVKGGGET